MFVDLNAPNNLKRAIFNAIVAPRPIGWISSVSAAGKVNLAPFSHFNLVSTAPPTLIFSCNSPPDRPEKDSVANARATGEFAVNLVTRDLAEAMNRTSMPLPHGEDEFELAGLEKAPCNLIRAPRVKASPASFECRVLQIVEIQPERAGETKSNVVFGRIIGVHIADDYLDDRGRFLTAKARPLARLGGDFYSEASDLFELRAPFKKV